MQEVPLTLTNFKQRLEAMGYQPFQVDLILKETIGDVYFDKLTTADQIINSDALQRYYDFANNCRVIRSRRTGTMEWSL